MRRRLLTAACIAFILGLALGVNSTHAGQSMQTVPTEGSTPTYTVGATSTTAAQPTSQPATAQPGAATPTNGASATQAGNPVQEVSPTAATLTAETAMAATQATPVVQTALPAETQASAPLNQPQITATGGQSSVFLPSVGTKTASNDGVKKIYILAFGIGLLIAIGIIALLVIRRVVRKHLPW